MRLRRVIWRINPPFSPLEIAVIVITGGTAFLAGYLYGLDLWARLLGLTYQ